MGFPTEIANDEKWPATSNQGPGAKAKLRKYAVVKVPRSVYAAIPGRNKYRPSQTSPIPNLTMAGDWTSQKFLGSMEGAVLAGKLAAQVIVDRALGYQTQGLKKVQPDVVEKAASHVPKDPPGIHGDSPIAFGGGMVLSKAGKEELLSQDKGQFIATEQAKTGDAEVPVLITSE